jgi:ribonuclease-3
MEALLGAIYLDQGLSRTKKFIFKQVEPFLERVRNGKVSVNYKALLQEFTQKEKIPMPVYRVVDIAGPDHDKQFTVEVLLDDKVVGVGRGKSKKAAELKASQLAWLEVRCNYG